MYSQNDYHVLLAHILRSPAIAELAIPQLEASYFVRDKVGGSPFQAVLFRVIKGYWKEYQTTPDDAVLVNRLKEFIKQHIQKNDIPTFSQEFGSFMAFRATVDERSEGMARDLVAHIAQICVYKPALDEVLKDAKEAPNIKNIVKRIQELEAQQSATQGGLSITGLASMAIGDEGQRVPTGIPWLDALFGDGAGPVLGCVMAILAPQGCGKTTLGFQLAISQAKSGRHVMLVLAEEGLTLSVRCKIYACALGIDYPLIQAAPGETMNDKIRYAVGHERLNKAIAARTMAMIDKYLHVLDLVSRPGGVALIKAEMHHLAGKGEQPVYTYVDWAGIIADREMALSGRTKEQELKTLSYELSSLAQATNSIIAISQQMAPAIVTKGPFRINDHYCAADCKGFTEPMKYVFVINPREPRTKFSLCYVAKSRDDAPPDPLIVYLQGERATFNNMDEYEKRGQRFQRKRAKELLEHRTPTEGTGVA